MSRRAGAVVCAVVGLAAAAGCAEIAGLGDSPVVDARDGSLATWIAAAACTAPTFDAGNASCQTCLQSQCCAPAAACAQTPGCSLYEACLIPCGTDYACRARCSIESPPASNLAANLDTCLVSRCSSECGVNCGSASYVEPDAADKCQDCLSSKACTQAMTCFTDPACSEVSQCAGTALTWDQQLACGLADPDAASTYLGYIAGGITCSVACGVGSYWECVGKVPYIPPAPKTDVTVNYVYLRAKAYVPLVGATVQACGLGTQGCATPVGMGTTDAAGKVAFTFTSDGFFSFDGYLAMHAPNTLPLLTFLQTGIVVPRVVLNEAAYTPDDVTTDYLNAGITYDPKDQLGIVRVVAQDCHWLPSSGVVVDITGMGPKSVRFYPGDGGGFARAGQAGTADFLAMPPGLVKITVTAPGVGVIAHDVPVLVQANAVTFIAVHPDP